MAREECIPAICGDRMVQPPRSSSLCCTGAAFWRWFWEAYTEVTNASRSMLKAPQVLMSGTNAAAAPQGRGAGRADRAAQHASAKREPTTGFTTADPLMEESDNELARLFRCFTDRSEQDFPVAGVSTRLKLPLICWSDA